MRIKTFNLLATQEAEEYTLKNCPVVIDASYYFYSAYKDSGVPFAFGCECDKYAEYIRELLSMFEKANVNCYFLFKGGIPLVEFQYCLQHLNYLNALCGEPYEPTNYSKTYNGTFVYKILYKIKKQHNNKLLHNCNITNYMDFVRSDLKCAPGVTAFLLDIMESLKGFKGEMADDIINFSN